jgi:predicted HTH domain antitoxin
VKPKGKFKAVRGLVTRRRVLLAVERYKNGEVSLGKAAELAGLPAGQMMTVLTEFGVESRIEKEDYLQGLHNLSKVW